MNTRIFLKPIIRRLNSNYLNRNIRSKMLKMLLFFIQINSGGINVNIIIPTLFETGSLIITNPAKFAL